MAHPTSNNHNNHNTENSNNNNEVGRQQIEQSLETIIENLRRFTITIEEYSSESQSLIFEKINSLIKDYEQLDGVKNLYDVHVPFEIFDFIDQGKNPDLYIKTYLENCLRANEQTKGKIEAIEAYKNELDAQLSQLFPVEYAEYKSVSTDSIPTNNGTSGHDLHSSSNNIVHNGNTNVTIHLSTGAHSVYSCNNKRWSLAHPQIWFAFACNMPFCSHIAHKSLLFVAILPRIWLQ